MLQKLGDNANSGFREYVARNEMTPPAMLVKLAADKKLQVRQRAASNAKTPFDTLTGLLDAFAAGEEKIEIVRSLASNRTAPSEFLERIIELTDDDDTWIRLTYHRNCNEAVMRKLASSKNTRVLSSLAENPDVPQDIMDDLVQKGDEYVLNSMLYKDDLPATTLLAIARRMKPESKLAGRLGPDFVDRPNLPVEVVDHFIETDNEDVIRAIIRRHALSDAQCEILLKRGTDYDQVLANSPRASDEIMSQIAVRTQIPNRLLDLIENKACGPKTMLAIIERLVEPESRARGESILYRMIQHPKFNTDVRAALEQAKNAMRPKWKETAEFTLKRLDRGDFEPSGDYDDDDGWD
jgi:hypothetical protein